MVVMTCNNDLGVFTPDTLGLRLAYISSLTLTYSYLRYMRVNNSRNQGNVMPYEVRKVQDSMRCLMVSIPRRFARWMQVEKGTLVRIHFDSDERLGNRLIIHRVSFKDGESEE
jgi:hypothetical protein